MWENLAYSVLVYLSIVEQPDVWVWLRIFILWNQCNLPAVLYKFSPPPRPLLHLTFTLPEQTAVWPVSWLVSSWKPEPFNLHCNYFNDWLACLYANVRMGLETGMSDFFEILYLKKNEIAHALLLFHSIHMNCVISLLKKRKTKSTFCLFCTCVVLNW